MKKNDKRQVGALPIRYSPAGVEILLVTSRETGRWVIPKGWRSTRLSDWDSAKREAREEAGARGRMWPEPIGAFTYLKRLDDGARFIDVDVYLMLVEKLDEDWSEKRERRRVWMSAPAAARCVREPGLKRLLLDVAAGRIGETGRVQRPTGAVKSRRLRVERLKRASGG